MLDNLKKKPEEYRRKFALGVSSGIFLAMFFSWSYFNGFFGFSDRVVAVNTKTPAQIVAVSDKNNTNIDTKSYSPFQSASNTFSGVFGEITKQYEAVRDSMASVLVPFVTNIDVYEKTK